MTMCLIPPSLSFTSTEKEFETFLRETTLLPFPSFDSGGGGGFFGSLKKKRTKKKPKAKRMAPAPKLP